MEFVQFSKEDCGKEMSLEESKKVQLDMLEALAAFCDKNGLRYFLSGGTLLGAIRHKGFIPWDDDIDVNMPRPDCERLVQLTGGRIGQYNVMEPDLSRFFMDCKSYRLFDFNTVIESYLGGITKNHPIYYPIFIDIFPIEGLPDGKLQTKLHYMKMTVLQKMQRSCALDYMMAKSIRGHIFHVITRIPAKLVGYRRWSLAIQKTAQKYSFNSQKYIGVMTAGIHKTEEKVKKEDYMKITDVIFEGKYYHAPGNYDTYLSQLYGDYMKMPPIEKQQSHHVFNMYWRNSNSI